MDIKSLINQTFNRTVEKAQVNTELKRSMRAHPKVNEFLSNIYSELLKVHALRVHQGKPALKAQTIVDTIEGLTNQLIMGLDIEANRKAESELKRIARVEQERKQKDLEASSEGDLVGAYEELSEGVEVGETLEESV